MKKTTVFLSWSGEVSKSLAKVFDEWIESIFPNVDAFFSEDDISKGAQWNSAVLNKLKTSKIGILFLVKDNLNAPWLMFEAGALSKNGSQVIPVLFEVTPEMILFPLKQFQISKYNKEEIKKVVEVINGHLKSDSFTEVKLNKSFEIWWPILESNIKPILVQENVKIAFRELEIKDQIFTFLDSIARQKIWTFYSPRDPEISLNGALVNLVKGIVDNQSNNPGSIKDEFFIFVKKWLYSDNSNLKFFASDTIGYFKDGFSIFSIDLKTNYHNLEINTTWEFYQLNCLWANCRLNNYDELNDFLLKTTNKENLCWILEAYEQMILNKDNPSGDNPSLFMPTIQKLDKEKLPEKAQKIIDRINDL